MASPLLLSPEQSARRRHLLAKGNLTPEEESELLVIQTELRGNLPGAVPSSPVDRIVRHRSLPEEPEGVDIGRTPAWAQDPDPDAGRVPPERILSMTGQQADDFGIGDLPLRGPAPIEASEPLLYTEPGFQASPEVDRGFDWGGLGKNLARGTVGVGGLIAALKGGEGVRRGLLSGGTAGIQAAQAADTQQRAHEQAMEKSGQLQMDVMERLGLGGKQALDLEGTRQTGRMDTLERQIAANKQARDDALRSQLKILGVKAKDETAAVAAAGQTQKDIAIIRTDMQHTIAKLNNATAEGNLEEVERSNKENERLREKFRKMTNKEFFIVDEATIAQMRQWASGKSDTGARYDERFQNWASTMLPVLQDRYMRQVGFGSAPPSSGAPPPSGRGPSSFDFSSPQVR